MLLELPENQPVSSSDSKNHVRNLCRRIKHLHVDLRTADIVIVSHSAVWL